MYEYELIRSQRKTLSMSIGEDLKIVVKAPPNTPKKYIDSFVEGHSKWIDKHRKLTAQRIKLKAERELTSAQIEELIAKAQKFLPERIERYGKIIGVSPTGVKITSAVTRWGSCSGKNSLCFSYRLMQLPEELIDYVVVHELVHIRIKNHSQRFYQEVERYMPDYQTRAARIKQW